MAQSHQAGVRTVGVNRKRRQSRRGAVLLFGVLVLLVMFYMAAFAIDVGLIVLTQAELQNAADAAVLAATLELGAPLTDEEIATNAKNMAIYVASLNRAAGRSVYLSPDDVQVGVRSSDGTSEFGGDGPYNAVRVTARRNQDGFTLPDGELKLYWARVIGHDAAKLRAVSLGVLTPRDLAFVLDVSGSMGDDTSYAPSLTANNSQPHNMSQVFDDLFGNGLAATTPTTGSGGWPGHLVQYTGNDYTVAWTTCWNRLKNNNNIPTAQRWDINRWFPGGSSSTPPASSTTGGRYWRAYVEYVYGNTSPNEVIAVANTYARSAGTSGNCQQVNTSTGALSSYTSTTRRYMYGKQTFAQFLLHNGIAPIRGGTTGGTSFTTYNLYDNQANGTRPSILNIGGGPYVRYQPIHAVREGAKVGISAVESAGSIGSENDFDRVALSSFGTRGTRLASGGIPTYSGGIATSPVHLMTELTNTYATARTSCDYLFPHGMGGPGNTNIGEAIQDGIWLLLHGKNSRPYSNKAIALLTDGQPTAGTYSGTTGIPSGSWDSYDKWALYNAHLAAEQNIRIHTIGLGLGADPALMGAIADMTGGTFYDLRFVTPANRQSAINDAFETIGKDRLGKLFRFTSPE